MTNKETLIEMVELLKYSLEQNYFDDWSLDEDFAPILDFIYNNF